MRALTKSAGIAAVAVGLVLAGGVTHASGTRKGATAAAPGRTYVSAEEAQPGTPIASMADQYNRPHAGPYSATGASAWVRPSPPPAYVDTSPPPPRAAEPPAPAAVRNREPGASAAAAAVSNEIPRPEAAAPTPSQAAATVPNARAAAAPTARPAAAPAAVSVADMTKGRALFNANGCGGCHTLADAGGMGVVGPGFDGNRGLTPTYVFNTVHDGRNAMPSFAGTIPDADIRALANYIVAAAKK